MQMRSVLAAIAFMSIAGTAMANDGPSYEQTLDFIIEKVEAESRNSSSIMRHDVREIRRCVLSIYRHSTDTTGGTYGDSVFIQDFDLSELDPSEISQTSKRLNLSSRERREVVRIQSKGRSKNSEYMGTGVELIISSDRNAGRVRKAFQHLILLCGGKEELF